MMEIKNNDNYHNENKKKPLHCTITPIIYKQKLQNITSKSLQTEMISNQNHAK